jgi:putative ABC transport system permease protein
MLRNHILIAFRNLKKQKIYTGINIIGLSIGIACTVLIYFFIRSEWSYDRFHPNYERIYRVAVGVNFRGMEYWTTSPYPLADAVVREVPGVERTTRWMKEQNRLVRVGDEIYEHNIHLVDSEFFRMFNFPLEVGDPTQIVSDPNAVIISSHIRDLYFPDTNPVGKPLPIRLRGDDFTDYMIAGVAAPIHENSSIRFDFLMSHLHFQDIYGQSMMDDWFPKTAIVTFVQTQPDVLPETLAENLEQLAVAHNLGQILRTDTIDRKLYAQPIHDMHFDTEIQNTVQMLAPGGDVMYPYILGGVALFILLIASINFMNLAVGLSAGRTQEVGVRKVFGAKRFQLMKQFWSESILFSFAALVLGLFLAELLLPIFNELTDKQLAMDYLSNPETVLILLALTLCVGLVAGLYPALVLSGFQPVTVFGGAMKIGGNNVLFRAMIVLQFGLSILLISCTLLMSRQLTHLTTFDLGWNPDRVLYQTLGKGVDDAIIDRYRQQVTQHPNVAEVASGRGMLFGESAGSMWSVSYNGESTSLPVLKINYEFLDVLGIPLQQGRNFSRETPTDRDLRIIVNERFVQTFGLQDPVGKDAPFGMENNPVIIGVVGDFHFMSLRNNVDPLAMYLRADSPPRDVYIKLTSTDDFSSTIRFLREQWELLAPDVMFSYTMLEDEVRSQYQSEENFQRIMTTTSYVGIIIACLGLFGMTTLSVARRKKEMGIRKVLGASSADILSLFNREYLWLIVIANILAWPVAYLAMQDWLTHFMYRVSLDPLLFLFSTLIVVVLAVATISIQSIRAVHSDPVNSLRNE